MIDYYLKRHCSLTKDKSKIRCKGCIWLDKDIRKCIFSLDYPKIITIEEFTKRIKSIDLKQQQKLSNSKRRFVL